LFPFSDSLKDFYANPQQKYQTIDSFCNLVLFLVKSSWETTPSGGMNRVFLLNRLLVVLVLVMNEVYRQLKQNFPQKVSITKPLPPPPSHHVTPAAFPTNSLPSPQPFFRLFLNLLVELNSPERNLEQLNLKVLISFSNAFHLITPDRIPTFAFAWLELISHRSFMPKLLLLKGNKGWPHFQRLLVDLFRFLSPSLQGAEMNDPIRFFYRGTLKVMLVLLHDFPEFLCDHHFTFCDVIPSTCIQLRNLILSAFPRSMRLPDPFTPNLKVDLLPEISQSPRILSDITKSLQASGLRQSIDLYLRTRGPVSFLLDLRSKLLLPPLAAQAAGTRYNVPVINALVLYVGTQAIGQLQSSNTQQGTPLTHSAPMDIFQQLVVDLDQEGRYYFLNAIANQLRYPNSHTHYFSCILLYLFAEANQEIILEQITRVLLERLIVNRPHPWGLLITFIELIKNPRYNFWSHGFTRCATEIEKLFDSVARSCLLPGKSGAPEESR